MIVKRTAALMSGLAILTVLSILLPWSRGPVLGEWGPTRLPKAGRQLWTDEQLRALLISSTILFVAAGCAGVAPLINVLGYKKLSGSVYVVCAFALAGCVGTFLLYFGITAALYLGNISEGLYVAGAASCVAFALVGRPLIVVVPSSSPPVAIILHAAPPGAGARSYIAAPSLPLQQCPQGRAS